MDIESTKNRLNVYRFLSSIYISEPTVKFIQEIKNNFNESCLKEAIYPLNIEMLKNDEEKVMEEFLSEYTRLFLGPGKHISPYASVWTGGEYHLRSSMTDKIKAFIESSGLNYIQDWHGFPDHIGILFEFMSHLIEKHVNAYLEKDFKEIDTCLVYEKRFFDQFISIWAERFCQEIEQKARLNFYKKMATLTIEFIEKERCILIKNNINHQEILTSL